MISRELLYKRALLKKTIRALLDEWGLIEVDVPLLYPAVCPDPAVEPIKVSFGERRLYLQPSPELNLKKIIADCLCDCYSLNYAYRADPSTDLHHAEFLMLELYLIGDTYRRSQDLTVAVIQKLLGPSFVRRRTYLEVWEDVVGMPYQYTQEYFQQLLNYYAIDFKSDWSASILEDLFFGVQIQPTLGQGQIDIIDGFPLHHAALALVENNGLAARYEVFIGGIEVANGYNELSGARVNEDRFLSWQNIRSLSGQDPCLPLDRDFFRAMERLPYCSGVAIGLERLFMKALKCRSLKDSIPFYWHI